MTTKRSHELIALGLVLAGFLIRLAPHPPNFTPLTAIAIFSGAVFPPGMALTVPLLAMIASDLFLQPHSLFWLVWACFSMMIFIGIAIGREPKFMRIAGGTLAGSVLFFILTNLGVFLFDNMYTKDFSGLVQCYTMAIPFFKNSLVGDFFYTFFFFGIFNLLKNYSLKAGKTKVVAVPRQGDQP